MLTDIDLMQRVATVCGPLFDTVNSPNNPFSKAFVMALTANETGAWIFKEPIVPSRFEPTVFAHLSDVAHAQAANYGSLTTKMLAGMDPKELHDYASSWSLTQMMGYHCLEWGIPLAEIQRPETHYKWTLKLLGEFKHRFLLDPERDVGEFFRAWNSGNPRGKTFDPDYVSNGMSRMQAYQSLAPSPIVATAAS